MAFDHGVLNIPGRNKNFLAKLDRHKAEQAALKKAEAKARSAQHKQDKAQAKALLAEHGPAIVAQMSPGISKRQNVSLKQAARAIKHELDQMAKWEPAKFLALVERFKSEQAAA